MKHTFIKVVSPEVAEQLVLLGFQYIKEQNAFVFPYSDELIAVMQQQYSRSQFACESKLRF
jgi:hypothetical protein